jgi:uncharacterized membrane protein YhhN
MQTPEPGLSATPSTASTAGDLAALHEISASKYLEYDPSQGWHRKASMRAPFLLAEPPPDTPAQQRVATATLGLYTVALAGAITYLTLADRLSWQHAVGIKLVPIVCMGVVVAVRLAEPGGEARRFITPLALAYAFHAGGDVCLESPSSAAFVGGMGCFFVAHALNVVGFSRAASAASRETWRVPLRAHWPYALPLVLYYAVMLGVLYTQGQRSLHSSAVLSAAVPVYAGVLLLAVAAAATRIGHCPAECRGVWVVVTLGYCAYAASDTILAASRFCWPIGEPARTLAVMITCFAAQLTIAAAADCRNPWATLPRLLGSARPPVRATEAATPASEV